MLELLEGSSGDTSGEREGQQDCPFLVDLLIDQLRHLENLF